MSITVKNTGPEIVTIACGSACITLPPGATIETTFSDGHHKRALEMQKACGCRACQHHRADQLRGSEKQ